ncbi:protein of unknown function DUF48 [Thermovirga lienii DSM 17291]|uniref:Uncharacterized protein n=1 Tax=Thermovirga lienii (strain ATCC BAA-1197 / DSM 17291 / Cas60314) TaxID=580340 RepID=G7V6F3_THELD|nr:protein of unknown function DUF48 [Thermovirga lienii DSM 17291]
MPNQLFLFEKVEIGRHINTLKVKNREKDVGVLVPVLQISEIFALGGACPDNAALSLLAEKAVPLHIFDNKTYEGSWMPYMSILSGQVSMAQYMVLFDKDLTLKIAQEIVRGACRLRCSVARKWFRKDADMWESKYLDCLSKIYTKSAPSEKVIREILELDYERITTYLSDIDWYAFAEGIAKATVVSAFSRLSLDPWINALSIMDPCFGSSPNLCVNSLWQIRSPRFKLHLPGYRHYSPPSAVFLC